MYVPGGYSPDNLRGDERFLNFVRHFDKEKKDIYMICHGPQLLVNADVLHGKDATAVKQVGVDVTNAGGNYIDQAVAIDDSGLISSRTPISFYYKVITRFVKVRFFIDKSTIPAE